MSDFRSLVESKLEPVGQSGDDIIYKCPKCDDKSGHLYIHYDKNKYHCFKCGLKGNTVASLVKLLGMSLDIDYEKLYSDRDEELDSIISPKKNSSSDKVVDYSTDLISLTEYYNLHTIPLSSLAYEYLLKRGVSPGMIAKLEIREGISRYGEKFQIRGKEYIGRDYSGRVLVPSRKGGGLVSFYVGRDYIGTKSNKYVNCSTELAIASEDVWSLDIIDSPCVIICEGVFTAIAVNEALGKSIACATYGKSIAHKSSIDTIRVTSQGEKLLSKKFEQYIIFYDKDAWKESYDTAKYLYDRGAKVRVVNITTEKYGAKADAADMTKEEVIEHIKNSEEFSDFSGIC